MTLTRANVEAIIVQRVGAYMTAAGMVVTIAGSNANLNDPIGYAVRMCDGTVVNYTSVSDTDVATVSSADYDKLLDIAELRTLDSVVSNLDDVDIMVGPRSERLSQLALNANAILDRKAVRIEKLYGIGSPLVGTGAVVLDFADHNETIAGVSDDI